MILNFSLLYFSFSSATYSPIIASTLGYFPTTSQFHHITVQNLFNNFFFYNSHRMNDQILFKNSLFRKTLNSVLFFESDLNDFAHIITEQIELTGNNFTALLDNCCFYECASTNEQTEGGAIRNLVSWLKLNLTSCLFSKCTAVDRGGAISNEGQNFDITSSVFSGCETKDTGMAIFYNCVKRYNSMYFTLNMNHVGFVGNRGKSDVIDLDVKSLSCYYINFTRNYNFVWNSPESTTQNCVLPILNPSWTTYFRFANIIENSADYIFNFNEKPDGQFFYFNIMKNYNLNYFFHFERIYSEPLQGEPLINLNNFIFYGNKPRSADSGITIANPYDVIQFRLKYCIFDFSKAELDSKLNGHYEENSQFDISPVNTHTFDQNFILPSICVVDLIGATPTGFFESSLPFDPSSPFEPTSNFSPSSEFSKTSYFSRSSIFSKSSNFKPSSPFTRSSYFTASSTLKLASSTSNFTPSKTLKNFTSTFTPSNPFTPSFTFSPQRTKVPDPDSIFNKVQVTGRRNIFTKEELKKAAAPASISLAIIIVSVILMALYLRRKIKEIRNPYEIPDFDTSLDDDLGDESDSYSYSYFTYEYYYSYVSNYSYYDSYSYSDNCSQNRMLFNDPGLQQLGEKQDDQYSSSYSEFTYSYSSDNNHDIFDMH